MRDTLAAPMAAGRVDLAREDRVARCREAHRVRSGGGKGEGAARFARSFLCQAGTTVRNDGNPGVETLALSAYFVDTPTSG